MTALHADRASAAAAAARHKVLPRHPQRCRSRGLPQARAWPSAYALPRDPNDEPYLNVAIAANATFLVSRDLDLLDLMQDATFRQQFPSLTILDPVAFLQVMANRDLTEHQELS